MKNWLEFVLITFIIVVLVGVLVAAKQPEPTATWYSNEEYPPGSIMANGEEFNDEAYTCASWDHPLGTFLRVHSNRTGKIVCVRVTDRGPNKKYYKKGRVLDLSKRAFSEIDDLKQGLTPISVKVIE